MKKIILILISIIMIVSCNLSQFNGTQQLVGPQSSLNTKELFDTKSTVNNFTVTRSVYTDTIKLSWDKTVGASVYQIQRANLNTTVIPSNIDDKDYLSSIEDKWEDVNTITDITSSKITYDDLVKNKDKNTYYAYRVFAQSLQTLEKNQGSIVQLGSYLTSPSDVNVSKGEDEKFITITFSPTPGVNRYNIYKSYTNSDSDKSFVEVVSPKLDISNNSSDNILKNEINDNVEEKKYICIYNYNVIENNDSGKQIYFSVKSVGTDNASGSESGNFSESSAAKLGYSAIAGAPRQPELSTNKGEETNSISIKFKSLGDDVVYKILRTKQGGSEQIVLDTEDEGDKAILGDSENDYYTFVDDNSIAQNTEYTYTVYGKNEYGIGKSSSIVSYTLSPVKDVRLTPVDNAKQYGYRLDITPPVGWDDKNLKNSISYTVTQTFANGENQSKTVTPSENGDIFYQMSKEEKPDEIREVSVVVKNSNSNNESAALSYKVYGIPDVPTSFSGTQNVYDSSFGPNTKCQGACDGYKYNQGKLCSCIGTYPIRLTWTKAETDNTQGTPADHYVITRSDNKNFSVDIVGEKYDDKKVAIGKKYKYTIKAVDALGRSKGQITTLDCWPSLTPEQFLYESIRHVLKPYGFQDEHPDWAKSAKNGGIWGKISAGFDGMGTGALGNASGEGLNGKKIYYYSAMDGIGGKIQFGFDDGFTTKEYIKMIDKDKIKSNTPEGVEITLRREKMNDFNANVLNGYWSYVNASGDAKNENDDVTYYNNNKAYLIGQYVPEGYANYIDFSKIYTKSKKFVGTYTIRCYYNTLSGDVISVEKQVAEKTISEKEYSPL